MCGKYSRDGCIELLKTKQSQLREAGLDRYPQRSDFSESEVVAIKAFLGPWPRALEAAGIKPARDGDRAARNREKRIRAKRRRTAALREQNDRMKSADSDRDQSRSINSAE